MCNCTALKSNQQRQTVCATYCDVMVRYHYGQVVASWCQVNSWRTWGFHHWRQTTSWPSTVIS